MKRNKKNKPAFRTAEVITLVILTCVVSLLMGIIISSPKEPEYYELSEADKEIQNFLKQYNYIVENYYGEIDKKEILKSALEGMINALGDPYSTYFDETASSNFNTELNGSYSGVGIEITSDGQNIIVSRVFENTPAKIAGIKPLDIILSINNQSTTNLSTTDLVEIIKEGETFIIEIKRGDEIKTVTVNKEVVTLNSVTSEIIEKNNKKVGYINVSIFALNTASQFQEQLRELEKDKVNSLIIDLRGNSGGHLTTVEEMISMFLDDTHIIYQIESKAKITKHYSNGEETKTYPIVVLINESSASASEMMAAALQESYGATLVGKTTYGKGTVQELQESDDIQYKITTKKWLTPNGNWINQIGVTPEIEVELGDEYLNNPIDQNDNQLQKALEILTK